MRLNPWRKVVLVAAASLLLIASTAAVGAADDGDRAWWIEYEGEFDMFVEPDWCPEGTAPVHLWGSGRGSQIDRYTFEAWHCADLEAGVFYAGVVILTDRFGDEMHGTYDGYFDPAPVATHYYDGGTGRYADVVGVLGPAASDLIWTSETTGFASGTMYGSIGR